MIGLGTPEVVVLLVAAAACLAAVAAGGWALLTLRRIRTGQDGLRTRLDAIERLLQRTT